MLNRSSKCLTTEITLIWQQTPDSNSESKRYLKLCLVKDTVDTLLVLLEVMHVEVRIASCNQTFDYLVWSGVQII